MSDEKELKETLTAFQKLLGTLMSVLGKSNSIPGPDNKGPTDEEKTELDELYRKKLATADKGPTDEEKTELDELYRKKLATADKSKKAKKPKKVAPHLVEEFEKWFITAPEDELYNVKRGQWECKVGCKDTKTAHVLLFHSLLTNKIKDASNVICIRPVGSKITIFNGSRITYGTGWRAQKQPQAIAEAAGATPIPFENVVAKDKGAGLKLELLEIVEWTGAERLIIPPISRGRDWTGEFYVVNRHFAGSTLLKIEDKYFLFDADREELKEHGFNPFFTQLPGPVDTIDEAYASLMPAEVVDAMDDGTEVIRQGEFFFVKQNDENMKNMILADPTDYNDFFYDQLMGRLALIGAAQVNCNRETKLKDVNEFLKRCGELNGGHLPEQSASSTLKAEAVLAPYIEALEDRVGPEEADYIIDPKEDYSRNSGEQPVYTHLGHVNTELSMRLERVRGIWEDGKWVETHKPIGFDAKATDIMYQRSLNASTGAGVGGRGRHQATAVFQPGEKEAYVTGAIFHTGREHFPRFLPGWWRVYPNTAVNSWTVDGDVD